MIDIGAAMDTGFTVLLIMVCAGCVIALGIFIWHMLQYKHKFRIKKITGTKTIVVDDKAKEFKDRDGITWWKLMKQKHIIAVPPADCLDVTERGRHSVEAYYSDESGYQYEKSASGKDLEDIPSKGVLWVVPEITKKWFIFKKCISTKINADMKKARFVFIEDRHPSTKGTDVLQTKQKVIMVNQLIKAKARKGFNWREHVPLIVGATALVMIVAVVFMFFDNVVEPIEPLVNQLTATQKSQEETTRMMQEMIQKKQIIPAGMVAAMGPQQLNMSIAPPG